MGTLLNQPMVDLTTIIVKKANLYGKSDEGKRVKVIGVVKANGMGLRFSRIFKNSTKQWSNNVSSCKC